MKRSLPFASLLLLVAALALRAQPQPAPETPPAAAEAAPAPVAPLAPAAEQPAAAEPAPAEPLPPPAVPVEAATPAPMPEPVVEAQPNDHRGSSEVFMMGADALLPVGNNATEVIAIFGNAIVDGAARNEVVAILGDTTVNGSAREAVAVLGNVTVNGTVNGNVVAVLGNVQLGPGAVVNGEAISILGVVDRAPGATVRQNVKQIGFGKAQLPVLDGLKAWFRHCFAWARPLSIDEHLGWAWMIAGAFLGFYLLLALVFGKAVDSCAETLEKSPGLTLVTSVLTMLLLPVMMVLLAITGIGPILLGLGSIAGTLFGKAALLAWIGRRITLPFGLNLPVLSTLIGGLILVIFYVIPVVGFIVWKLSGVLGLGMVVYTIISAMKRERAVPKTPKAAMPVPPVPPAPVPPATISPAASGFFAAQAPESAPGENPFIPPVMTAVVPDLPSAAMPRAGFWIRLAACALDVVLIAMVTSLLGLFFVPVLALYNFVLWSFKGTTIGGVICGLKIVRLDGREMDWKIALVRCLAAFLSFVVAGLGFIWVAFDDECQSWHDKIAGTTIVRVPKGTPLI